MVKKSLSTCIALALFAGSTLFAAETTPAIGVVNFATCVTESKSGKKEQDNFAALRKQMESMVESTEKELKEISAKLEDTEYLESLSPKAEEELKAKLQERQEDMSRYQNQFYQVLQHANYQMMQKLNSTIASAAEKVAQEKNLDYVINKEMCFYVAPSLDVTSSIIHEMNEAYDHEQTSEKKLSENEEGVSSHEATETKAG